MSAPTKTAAKKAAQKAAPKAADVDAAQAAAQTEPLTPADSPDFDALRERIAELEARLADGDGKQPRNVVEAVIEVMRLVKAVGKDGRNEQQNFNFRGIDGVLNAVGPALRQVGVLCLPGAHKLATKEVFVGQRNTRMDHQTLEIVYTFYYSNADGEVTTLAVPITGEAQDAGDKSISKAFSVAYRTCLIQALSLPTHSPDPDEDSHENDALPTGESIGEDVERIIQQHKDDPVRTRAALIEYGNEHGAGRLSMVKMTVRDGEIVSADEFLRQWIGYFANKARQDAEQARTGQDGDAETPDPAASEAGSPEAAGSPDSPADTPADTPAAEPAPATEQEPVPAAKQEADAAAERHAARPNRSDQRKVHILNLARAEAEAYASVLKISPAEFIAPLLAAHGVAKFDEVPPMSENGIRGFLVKHRPGVIAELKKQRRPEAAQALTNASNAFPIQLSDLFGENSPEIQNART